MIQGYWIQEFAASLLNYAQKTKIQNHHKNTRYKSKCSQCCTRVSLHFKIPLGLISTCDKITSFTLLLFMIQYFTVNHGLFLIPCILESSCSGSPLVVIHRSRCCNSEMEFMKVQFRWGLWAWSWEFSRLEVSFFVFCLSTKCYSWKNLSFLHFLLVLYRILKPYGGYGFLSGFPPFTAFIIFRKDMLM